MKYQRVCCECKNIVTAYLHKLNVPMVRALRQLVDFHENSHKECNLQSDLSLTKNQYNNFQKLRHFGLVKRTKEGWYPTDNGIQFVYGKIPVQTISASMGNETLHLSHEAWRTHKSKVEYAYVQDMDVLSYKRRHEYAEEKSLQTTLV